MTLVAAFLGGCGGGAESVGSSVPVTGSQAQPAPGVVAAVSDSGSGAAMLSWIPPLENGDGSQLVDLVGYRLLYGRSADNLDRVITITNPSLSAYMIEGLELGTWYFSVLALNSRGAQSPPSNLATKTIS
jgi:hypothetical protein